MPLEEPANELLLSRSIGCLLGGAIGDALACSLAMSGLPYDRSPFAVRWRIVWSSA